MQRETFTDSIRDLWRKMGMNQNRLEIYCRTNIIEGKYQVECVSPDFRERVALAEKATDDAWERNR